MITYKLFKDYLSEEVNGVVKTDENITMSIPFDRTNKDYQEYLEWVAEGNEPEEADTPAEAGEARLDKPKKKLKTTK